MLFKYSNNSCFHINFKYYFLEISIERAFIICRVLVQRIKDVNVNYNLNVIPNVFDTAKSLNGMVYVKFNDYEFYPQYIVYYREHNLTQYADPYLCHFNYNQCFDQWQWFNWRFFCINYHYLFDVYCILT